MLRNVFSAVVILACLVLPARAEVEPGSANSFRICDKQSCRYVERASAVSATGAQRTASRRESRETLAAASQSEPSATVLPRGVTRLAQRATAAAAQPDKRLRASLGPVSGGGTPWINEARRYVGMTGQQLGVKHRGLWCGEFMGRVARATGMKTPANPNMAPDWRSAGQRIAGPKVGAIALISRGRGIGHVGIVTGVNENGDPIIISGNHKNRVVETAYPRGRVAGYVWPG
jgi:uncharacterized protein (TIGR02594 family)